ncbi:hypothetical protein FIBSPDRAFT_469171 [Athelia psychrophila]|uniref:Uncharacterized protein n=1 Tax=Athelia psychrophila TaxID=1759441 RepID=A0A166LFS7_9AGAM|nr:hypothetical protein FIBSPDRAFT_469171 [Fibularhizoctonia sp. CBS 109695]
MRRIRDPCPVAWVAVKLEHSVLIGLGLISSQYLVSCLGGGRWGLVVTILMPDHTIISIICRDVPPDA